MPETPSERTLRMRSNAYLSWAKTADPAKRLRPAWDAFDARFARQVDPDGTLEPADRARRAAAARRAYFLELARKSAKARRKKAS